MILLIDNYDSFTWNLVHALGLVLPDAVIGRDIVVARNDGLTAAAIETLNNGRPPARIIISPGPCTPREAGISCEVIERFAGQVPILGVCLGHQAIATVYGMRVAPYAPPVHGKTSLVQHDDRGVFMRIPGPFPAARYHSLAVDECTVPEGWTVSAWTDEPQPDGTTRRTVMGLRREWGDQGGASLEGVQFHPESFMTPQGMAVLKCAAELS